MDNIEIKYQLDCLAAKDPCLKTAIDFVGYPVMEVEPQGFWTLLNIIISQQISKSAANSIAGRIKDLLPEEPQAADFLKLSDEDIRAAGFSARKVSYAKDLAKAIMDKSFDLSGLVHMSDGDAIAAISSQRGFGLWSAEIYCMFSLGRKDIFPADDLALQDAAGRLKGMDSRPKATETRKIAAQWAPFRSSAALLLWEYYRKSLKI